MAQSRWAKNGGTQGLLGNPLFNMGLGILGNNRPGGNVFQGAMQGINQSQAFQSQLAEEKRRDQEMAQRLEDADLAKQDRERRIGLEDEELGWKREDRERQGKFRQQVAGILGGEQIAGILGDTRTASINPQLPPQQQPQLQHLLAAQAMNNPDAALQGAIQQQTAQQQAAQQAAARDAQMQEQFAQQEKMAMLQAAQAEARQEKALKAQQIRAQQVAEANAAKEQAKLDAKAAEEQKKRQVKVKNDFKNIADSEGALIGMMQKPNFADSVGSIDSRAAAWSPFDTKDKQVSKQAKRASRKAVINVIQSATFGGLSEGERQFIMESVPQETDDETVWVDWFNNEYLPRRNRVAVEAGQEPIAPMEITGRSLFSAGTVRPVGTGSQKTSSGLTWRIK